MTGEVTTALSDRHTNAIGSSSHVISAFAGRLSLFEISLFTGQCEELVSELINLFPVGKLVVTIDMLVSLTELWIICSL